jgi:hypothetical protein
MRTPSRLGQNQARRWRNCARVGVAVLVAGAAWAFAAGGNGNGPVRMPEVATPDPGPAQATQATQRANFNWITESLTAWDPEQPKEPTAAGENTTQEDPQPPRGLRFLGAIRSGDRMTALMAAAHGQRFLGVGDSFDGVTVEQIEEQWILVRDRAGSRRIDKASAAGPRLGSLGTPPTKIKDPRATGGDEYETHAAEDGGTVTRSPRLTGPDSPAGFSPRLRDMTGDAPAIPMDSDGQQPIRQGSSDDAEGS